MTDLEQAELRNLKQRLALLEQEQRRLGEALQALEGRVTARQGPIRVADIMVAKIAPMEIPPLVIPTKSQTTAETGTPLAPPFAVPPVLPTPLPVSAGSPETSQPPSDPKPREPIFTKPEGVRPVSPPPPLIAVPVQDAKGSFEMRLGTYWMVRIGMVLVLTGLVFFGNYAYQRVIVHLGAAGKVALLYLASGLLLGAGAWLQRRRQLKESVRNYAQVLFAGGLAAVYFTTYAAHHLPNLLLIRDPLLDGALLLAWAGFMVWIADRKKSEVLALFAVGLAYYTSVITTVGMFTLYSNLLLTAAAVFFLVRHRWAVLSYASLVATYGGYAYWRFCHGGNWHWATPEEGLWTGNFFLMGYWLMFTTAVFFSKHEKLAGENRATFLSLNNVAFFGLLLLTLIQVRHGGFWKLATGFGSVLLVLAVAARRFLPEEKLTHTCYLIQGLLLVTIGIIAKYSGQQLALMLAAESVVLLTLGTMRRNYVLQCGAFLTAAYAVVCGIGEIERLDRDGLLTGMTLGTIMLFNAWWMSRRDLESARGVLRPRTTFYTLLSLAAWLVTTFQNTTADNLPLVLAVEALVFTASVYVIGIRELTLFGQAYLLIAQFLWLAQTIGAGHARTWWGPALLILITLALSHWWQRQKIVSASAATARFWQTMYALGVCATLYFWLEPSLDPAGWMAWLSVLAIGVTVYGLLTRLWILAGIGQAFLWLSVFEFAWQIRQSHPGWLLPLVPIAVLGLFSAGALRWFDRRRDADSRVRVPILNAALVYRWAALVMMLGWVNEFIPARERIWVLALAGFTAFLFGGWRHKQEPFLFAAAFMTAALGLFWLPFHGAPTVYAPTLIAILLPAVTQRLASHQPVKFHFDPPIHSGMIAACGLSVWLFLSRWVLEREAAGFYLTASWSALGLVFFAIGILVHERMYRWLGLVVLAVALGRIVIVDVWKLETIYRVLSFMALGVTLLVLGFIYNKFQEKIRKWL